MTLRKLRDGLKIGDTVTVKAPVEAFYSNYAGNPVMVLNPGVIGTVGAIHVPVVNNSNHRPYGEYVCVDFLEEKTGKIQRASVSYDNIIVQEKEK